MVSKKERQKLLKLESDNTKYCSVCKKIKPLHEFGVNSKGRKFAQSGCFKCERDSYLRRNYGITLKEYEKLFEKQNGRCAICGIINSGNRCDVFCIDHKHKTGKIRGLLCTGCNRGLGFFNDDPGVLAAAITYLTQNVEKT